MGKLTIEQRSTPHEGFAKAGELIEIRGTGSLTLHDRRVYNLLLERAGPRLVEDVKHTVPLYELRGSHKGAERVKDSIIRLMQTVVEVPTTGRNGKPATKRAQLLSDTTTSDDDDDPTGEVVYSFTSNMREIIASSTHWGRIRGQVMFAFTSKYSLALYELISMRINLQYKDGQVFDLSELRELLGVPQNILHRTPDLLRRVIQPAELEVSKLAEFGVTIEPIRQGGTMRGAVTGFRVLWWKKDVGELRDTFAELKRPRVGRLPRLRGTAETVEPAPIQFDIESFIASKRSA